MLNRLTQHTLALLVSSLAFTAQAVPFNATPPDTLGPLNGGVVTYSVLSPGSSTAGGAILTFDLLGYTTVDGLNPYADTFSLAVNGVTLFRGGFDMGGGGSNFIDFIAPGVSILSSQTYGLYAGGLTKFSVLHTLLSGPNIYTFDYGRMQGLGDEGWGIRSIAIGADVNTSQVPEPLSISLIALGLLGLGIGRARG